LFNNCGNNGGIYGFWLYLSGEKTDKLSNQLDTEGGDSGSLRQDIFYTGGGIRTKTFVFIIYCPKYMGS
jgi:hypothetical protein